MFSPRLSPNILRFTIIFKKPKASTLKGRRRGKLGFFLRGEVFPFTSQSIPIGKYSFWRQYINLLKMVEGGRGVGGIVES